ERRGVFATDLELAGGGQVEQGGPVQGVAVVRGGCVGHASILGERYPLGPRASRPPSDPAETPAPCSIQRLGGQDARGPRGTGLTPAHTAGTATRRRARSRASATAPATPSRAPGVCGRTRRGRPASGTDRPSPSSPGPGRTAAS